MILRIAVIAPVSGTFDYLPPRDPAAAAPEVGTRVVVPFGRSQRVGVIVERLASSTIPAHRLKPVKSVLDPMPLVSADTLALADWAAGYYRHPLGDVFGSILPVPARRPSPLQTREPLNWALTPAGRESLQTEGRRAPRRRQLLEWIAAGAFDETRRQSLEFDWRRPVRQLEADGLIERLAPELRPPAGRPAPHGDAIVLNAQQRTAVATVIDGLSGFQTFLLQGVTGSGKTEVYLAAATAAIERGRQVLMLVPEIALTGQLINRVTDRMRQHPVVIHSGLTGGERARAWLTAVAGRADIVIGTRSAVWTPLARLGLIIVDEEHDASYKQGEGFRYSARDTAIMRARQAGVPIVMGSATPSLESFLNVARGRYRMLTLPERAGGAQTPAVRCVDLRNTDLEGGISPALREAIDARLARAEQTLLYLNRRGYAPILLCHHCGWSAECEHCSARLVYHKQRKRLTCHHCGAEHRWEGRLTCCQSPVPHAAGAGTERIEEALKRLFPGTRVARIDRDSTRGKGERSRIFEAVRERAVDILVGTQMIAKGHHFPHVTLVGIIDADSLLYGGDFRCPERFAQQLVQVAGRAGRADKAGEVMIQTHFPNHPLLKLLLQQGYEGFARSALAERDRADLPPYACTALLRASSTRADTPGKFLRDVAMQLRRAAQGDIQILGPATAPMLRRAGRYRWQLLLSARQRKSLAGTLDGLPEIIERTQRSRDLHWSLDVDPQDMM